MLHRGTRKAFVLVLMVVLGAALGVVAHADGTSLSGGTVTIQCHQQWEGNFCP